MSEKETHSAELTCRFKIGDCVRAIPTPSNPWKKSMRGRVVRVERSEGRWIVTFVREVAESFYEDRLKLDES